MKYLFVLTLAIFFFTSCSNSITKEEEQRIEQFQELQDHDNLQIEEILSQLETVSTQEGQVTSRAPRWWVKFKAWFNAHRGADQREINPCEGTGGCGPCSGMCFDMAGQNQEAQTELETDAVPNSSQRLSQEDYEEGLRLYSISIIENRDTGEEKLVFEFYTPEDYISNDKLAIPGEAILSTRMTRALDKELIILQEGNYPVEYTEDRTARTVVDAVIR